MAGIPPLCKGKKWINIPICCFCVKYLPKDSQKRGDSGCLQGGNLGVYEEKVRGCFSLHPLLFECGEKKICDIQNI